MGQADGFLKYDRNLPKKESVEDRLQNYEEFYKPFTEKETRDQAARCMSCGVPFCHSGCPLGNVIPEFNDAVYRKEYKEAYDILATTNNFPEFTGRICPAPCEGACVLGINKPPVAIEHIEKVIIEEAYKQGWVKPKLDIVRTGKNVAVIGAGPAGLAAADQLNKVGHLVTVFERAQKPGGLLRFGIPDFKLNKSVVERRVEVMEAEGVVIKCGVNVGVDIKADELLKDFDAVVLSGGATVPRDTPMPGRALKGVHFAMDFLSQNNARVSNLQHEDHKGQDVEEIFATDKNVVVIGGGDTGSDCVGTSNRHGATSVTQLEISDKPGVERAHNNPWPEYPFTLKTSTSHDEGCERDWSVLTKEFVDDGNGNVKGLKIVQIEWEKAEPGQRPGFKEIPGSEQILPCDLALLAVGFLGPESEGVLEQLGVELDARSNVKANLKDYKTSVDKVFTAGDMRRGQSLVVWAISEGRECAKNVDEFLMGSSVLESKDTSMLAI
ncbi:MAG: glutamate synthase (NADPH/NADH) small chain [Saprospiraceae bacterium]|jgi:glutamate synthase (NADPH/NADH) small chain